MNIPLIRPNKQTQGITTRTKLFLLLNLVDFALTAILIKQGIGLEGNPLLAWMPLWEIGMVKIGVVYLVAHYLRNRITVMVLLNLGIGIVVVWNMGCLILLG